MAEIVRMRRMSDTMEEGVIVQWLVNVGDSVKIGDVLAEVETDKATMDYDSQVAGSILHIEAKPGTTVPVDGIIAVIGKKGEDFANALAKAQQEQPNTETEHVATVEKATATSNQTFTEPNKNEEKHTEVVIANEPLKDGRIKASPLAKRMAQESGIDINLVAGTGEGGRIIRRDVLSYTPSMVVSATSSVQNVMQGTESFTEVSISQMRKSIARRLSESKFTAPHFYLTLEIDMDRVVEARQAINGFLETKVSFNDIIIKAVAAALKANPKVNASWMGNAIRYNNHVHIGVATAIDDGLIVPVVKYADTKSISAISTEVKSLAQKAKDKKLQTEEFSGNTFTISNLGMFGIEEFTAIINPPDACILAVGAIMQKPVVKNGAIVIGNVMKVTLSCDHRTVDGATGAKFLQTLSQFLEEPLRILA